MNPISKELSIAMAKAFTEITGALADQTNPCYKSKYADLKSVIDAIKPALSNNGLWFYQVTHEAEGYASVETVVVHESGNNLSFGKINVPVVKKDAQGYGSALTYARRYSLSSAFGVAPEDDDGNEACQPYKEKKAKPEEKPKEVKLPPVPISEQSVEEMVAQKRELIAKLLQITKMQDNVNFIKCLERKEKCCIETNRSYVDELKRCILNPEDTVEKFNMWIKSQPVKKELDNTVAA